MGVIIVGGDHLGSIPKELGKLGVSEVQHLTGRSSQKIRDGIPETMDFVIMLFDFVNHNLAHKIKDYAKNRGVPIVYAKRSWASIYQKMKEGQQQLKKAGLQLFLN